ncbi:hypothetical protein PTI98_003506 [Pleurotus ostreatus]|nr:hypothetical protein PTI98_003506 [Pleurotus ostreatus]
MIIVFYIREHARLEETLSEVTNLIAFGHNFRLPPNQCHRPRCVPTWPSPLALGLIVPIQGPYTILLLVNIPLFVFIPAAQLYKSRFCKDHAVVFNDSKMATVGLRSVIWINISCPMILVHVLFINPSAHIIIAQFYMPTPSVVILLLSLMLAAAFTGALAGALPYFASISVLDERRDGDVL